jgi:hypothetical protein
MLNAFVKFEKKRLNYIKKYNFALSKKLFNTVSKKLSKYQPTFISTNLNCSEIMSNTISSLHCSGYFYLDHNNQIHTDIRDLKKNSFLIIVVSISKTNNHIFPCVIGDNIEFFDPNGFKDDKSSYTKQIKKVISKVSELFPAQEIIHISETCKTIGPQLYSNPYKIKTSHTIGYCTIFTLLYAWLRLKYPKKNQQEVSDTLDLLAMNENMYIERFLTFSGIN